jgi:hypothetical protein
MKLGAIPRAWAGRGETRRLREFGGRSHARGSRLDPLLPGRLCGLARRIRKSSNN